MKKLLYLAFLCGLFIGLSSCEKEKEQEPRSGSVFGFVSDKTTGEPIKSAGVELFPLGLKTVTGSDGSFEFANLEEREYNLFVTKTGYKDYKSSAIPVKGAVRVDVQLELLPPSLSIVDDQGNEVTEIDFGFDQNDVMRSFTIYNNRDNKMNWSIVHSCPWVIRPLNNDSGVISSNGKHPLVVLIDRSKLNKGENATTIHIVSNNGTRQIKVTALAYHAPIMNLYEPSDVSYENVTLEASVTDPGLPEYNLFGFLISKNLQHDLKSADKEDKNISMSKKDVDDMMVKQNRIIQPVTNLTPNVTYYARAYTIRDIDTTYSNVISFVTKIPNLPKLTIKLSNEGVKGLTAEFDCEIIDNGGSEIEDKGVCWSTDPSLKPKDYTNKQSCGKGSTPPTFTAKVEEFAANKTYYVYSYAMNSDGIGYSDNPSIVKTSNGKPAVETIGVSQTSTESVDVRYRITNDAGVGITEHGVCYATTHYPDITTSVKSDESGDISIHTAHITGLKANTTYYFRAYAKNSAGEVGLAENEKDYMIQVGLPVVNTLDYSDLTSNSVVCKGIVTNDGGSDVIERGICWGPNAKPTISDSHKADIYDGVGVFSCPLTDLSVATTYYYRAYAKNKANSNYSYGDDKEFTTLGDAPTVQTLAATDVAGNSAVLHGRITNNGGATITNCGFVCSDGQTIEHLQNVNGDFSTTIKDLDPNKSYTYYAFAKNVYDEGKGGTQTFTTKAGTPVVINGSYSNVTATSATVTGKITGDGGSPITECGICYSSSNPKPTINDNIEPSSSTQVGQQFACELTGLKSSTKYYARAYAKNKNGTVYGYDKITFTTKDDTPSVKILQQPTYNGNSATVYGQITSDITGVAQYGVVYSFSNQMPSLSNYDAIQRETGIPSSKNITFTVTNIPSGAMLYYRFYVVSSSGKEGYSSSGYLIGY